MTRIIVEGMEDAAAAIPRVLGLDRRAVRRRFEQRFSATRMAKDYAKLYRSLLKPVRSLVPVESAPLQPMARGESATRLS